MQRSNPESNERRQVAGICCSGRARALLLALAALLLSPALAVAGEAPGAEQEIRELIETFLTRFGEGDLDAMAGMFVPDANVGVVRFRDGAWVGTTETFADYLARVRERQARDPEGAKFHEPIHDFTVTMESDQLAFARADTSIHRDGREVSRPVDYFLLIRVDGEWKFLSAAYIVRRAED